MHTTRAWVVEASYGKGLDRGSFNSDRCQFVVRLIEKRVQYKHMLKESITIYRGSKNLVLSGINTQHSKVRWCLIFQVTGVPKLASYGLLLLYYLG